MLVKALALEKFIHVCARNMPPEQYHELLVSKKLKKALIGFGSDKKNNLVLEIMQENGIEQYSHTPFMFR